MERAPGHGEVSKQAASAGVKGRPVTELLGVCVWSKSSVRSRRVSDGERGQRVAGSEDQVGQTVIARGAGFQRAGVHGVKVHC